MSTWHAHVAHMAKHMTMVRAPLVGPCARAPWSPSKSGAVAAAILKYNAYSCQPKTQNWSTSRLQQQRASFEKHRTVYYDQSPTHRGQFTRKL